MTLEVYVQKKVFEKGIIHLLPLANSEVSTSNI